MSAECCLAAYEPMERLPVHPNEPCHRYLDDGEEPCRMATGANYDNDKMAANDETLRALDHIREMCLDRPCPGCKSEVIDTPQEDLRQCRACGHVWGFDDTQNLEEFVREFARMEPCVECGNDSLDNFEVVQNDGRQQLVCTVCQSVQGTERVVRDGVVRDGVVRDGNAEGYEVVRPDHEGFGYPGFAYPEPHLPDQNPRRAMDLACPFCPDMTSDFFEKQFDRDELVRAVCPSCSYVVFYKGQVEDRIAAENGVGCALEADEIPRGNGVGWAREDDGAAHGNGVEWAHGAAPMGNGTANGFGVGWTQEDGRNGRRRRADRRREERERRRGDADDLEKVHLFPQVKRAMRYLKVKPIDLAQHALQECADSIIEEDDENLGPRLRTMAARQAPIVAEQLGWTIGTAVGNIMFRSPQGAALTGSVGSIVGRSFCDVVLQTMHNRRR